MSPNSPVPDVARSVSTLSQYLPDSASGHLAVTEVFRLIDQAGPRHPMGPEGISNPGWWFGTFFIFPNSWDDDPI